MTPVFVALTAEGAATARRVAATIGGEVHVLASLLGPSPDEGGPDRDDTSGRNRSKLAPVTFTDTAAHLRMLFTARRPIIGVCAAGIVIRILAPLLSAKGAEPPVLTVSEDGASIVPLLGGHHGANDLARALAAALSGHAAITTAGDTRFGVALDQPPAGWTLANPADAKAVMAALLDGTPAQLDGEAEWLEATRIPYRSDGTLRLIATTRTQPGDSQTLIYHPRRLVVGLGCERGADTNEVIALVEDTLSTAGLAPSAIAMIGSLDLKADEPAVLAAAAHFGIPARFFDAATLEAEAPRLQNPSALVFNEVGCHGVAEGAALAAVGPGGSLIVPKRKSARATCAVAEAPAILDPAEIGRARGRLAIIGIGPGTADWLTPEARTLLETSEAVVGYSLYLDLIAPIVTKATRHESDLGSEEARVCRALELAAEGRSVALVSSGDAGIYAMATLAFECLDQAGETLAAGATRIEIVVAPGISAMQAAAARAGAPLGHDFCAISLSDLLTPWAAIEARIRAAAEGDFVVAFYNPVSQRRRTQLARAKDILLRHRPPDTPVVLARNLGRDGEHIRTVTLADLTVDMVDMLTLVMVGASTTRQVEAGGKIWTYTPRGYEKKRNVDAAE